MPIRNIATLAVAILLGVVAVFLVRTYLTTPRPQSVTAQAAGGVPVVVAAQPIVRGAALQPAMLKVVTFPADSVPAGAFSSPAQLTGAKSVQRLVLRSLVPNEPVLPGKVTEPGGKLNLSSVLTGGMRAVSLRSNDVSGVGGFVLPGDRVDVLLTRAVGSAQQINTLTQVLAQDVLVLGVDQSDNDEADKPVVAKAVTVEVTPDQAQAIALGQAVGSVSLSLRQVGDDAPSVRHATQVAELGFTPRPAPPAGGATAPRAGRGMVNVRVTRGIETTGYSVSYR